MARGRRPDNSLEPSRQLLTQRAFRQRRAAHLSELEGKVEQLERENAALRGIEYEGGEGSRGGSRDGGMKRGTKRIKTETGSSNSNATTSASEELGQERAEEEENYGEGEDETSGLPACVKCGKRDKERLDLMKAVAAVDMCFSSLSASMRSLKQTLQVHHMRDAATKTTPALSPALTNVNGFPSPSSWQSHPSPVPAISPDSQRQVPADHLVRRYNPHDAPSSSSPSPMATPAVEGNRPTNGSSFGHGKGKGAAEQPTKAANRHSSTLAAYHSNEGPQQRRQGSHSVKPASVQRLPGQSVPSGANTSSSMTAGGRCCPSNGNSNEGTRQGRGMANLAGIDHFSQQQSYATFQPATHHLINRPAPLDPMYNRERQDDTSMTLTQAGGDENKCCLGFFECDSQGNIVVPPGSTS